MVTEEWSHEYGTSRANKIVGEVHLRKYGKFIEDFTNKLREIEETLLDNSGVFADNPISLKLVRQEQTDILQLVDTDNKILNKIIVVLASLCMEVRERKEEAASKFYNALLVFAEECENSDNTISHVAVSDCLPLLQELSCFVSRCHQVVVEIIQQLSVVYTTSANNQIINSSNVHFEDMMSHLGDVLVICVTLDKVISGMDNMHESWTLYKRLINTVQLDNVLKEKVKTFESVTKDLEIGLLSGKIFQNCVDKLSDVRHVKVNSSRLGEELHLYLRNMLVNLESKEPEATQMVNDASMLWVKVCCMFVLYVNLFGLHEKKLLKQVWDVAKKYPCVTLVANVIWFPDVFLAQHLSHILKSEDKKQQQAVSNVRNDFLNQKSSSIQADVLKYMQETCYWTIQLDAVLTQLSNNLTLEDLRKRCAAFLMGVKVAFEISRHLKLLMNLHAALGKPMTKTIVLSLCKLVELLKSLEMAYQRHFFLIAETVNHVLQYLVYQTLTSVTGAKNRLIADKTYTKKHLDTLSALVLTEKVLFGPVTAERCLIARLALSIARGNTTKALKDDEVEHIYSHLNQLNNICHLQVIITNSCDTSFLYFQRILLPIYFQNVCKAKSPCLKMSYLLNSLSDTVPALRMSANARLLSTFENEILTRLKTATVKPLCENIETTLRLQVHSHLRQDKNESNPLKATSGRDSISLMSVCPMKVFNYYVNVRSYVEHYLDTTFYNLTTVALHDWKSYGEMRSLAKIKHNLTLIPNHLPYQTLEQGLDVLEIMRNIHVFVSKYLYNLNNQIFVEQSSNNKHLNTINIRHISNSIRMHGTGIMSTTVNFTYQFLRKKFYIFSQFLFDEQIKSRLTKDIMYYKEHKLQSEQKYSYERADKFNKGIRKLGLSQEGLSYLDQFRILISQIGNAMGYVRMIRSGGLHCCSNSLNFISDLDDIVKFEDMCREDRLSESTCEAAKRVDHVIEDLTQNFAEGTQYFKLLVEVFANDFRNPKNNHLQNFYIIVPPLTINFVEYMITAKDKMNRRNKVGATFTDDGFAMGLAYVLKLLNQNKQLESLHWFQSVRDKYKRERTPLAKTGFVEDKLKTTNLLTAKRLDTYQQEFDLLYFSLSSARIFFEKQVNE